LNNHDKPGRKLVLLVGVLFNAALIGYYKYYDFFIENINVVFSQDFTLKHILLPLGISFFTFQQIAFLISTYKKENRLDGFLNYSLFVTFFGTLVAGPIVFYNEMVPQFLEEKKRYFNVDNFTKGLFVFILGVFKKVVIADSLAVLVDNGYNHIDILSFGGAWITSLSYTLQIYFDFSGYSEMALGLAKMFNFDVPINFYSPYKSKSITEFWKRWHMTLGRSLAVIVYFPLGGNRKGLARTCVNLFAVFLVSGIWHGAAWTFVIWGVIYGLLRVIEKLFGNYIDKLPGFIRVCFTFLCVNLLWVLFRSTSMNQAMELLGKMFSPGKISFEGIQNLAYDAIITYPATLTTLFIVGMVLLLLGILFFWKKNIIDYYTEFKPGYKSAVILACAFCIAIVHLSRETIFIYFNF